MEEFEQNHVCESNLRMSPSLPVELQSSIVLLVSHVQCHRACVAPAPCSVNDSYQPSVKTNTGLHDTLCSCWFQGTVTGFLQESYFVESLVRMRKVDIDSRMFIIENRGHFQLSPASQSFTEWINDWGACFDGAIGDGTWGYQGSAG